MMIIWLLVERFTKELENWKGKYQKLKQKYDSIQKELDEMCKDNQKLAEEKRIMQGIVDKYDRVVRVLGLETVEAVVQQDIRNEKALEEKQRMEQMPKGSIHERLAWGIKKSEMENQQRKKNKSKNREMDEDKISEEYKKKIEETKKQPFTRVRQKTEYVFVKEED